MKRFFFITALSVALFSCTKENDSPGSASVPTSCLREFSATIETDYATKARAVVSTGKVSFENSDEVVVSNGSITAIYVYDSSTDKFFAKSDPLPAADSYRAYYPASGYAGMGEGGAMSVVLPSTQTYDPVAVLQAPMGAYSTDGNFAFKNLCAIVEFSMSSGEVLTGVEFQANRSVSGNAVFSGTGSLALEMNADQAESVNMTMPESFLPDATTPVCLLVPAGTYPGGLSLTCSFSTGRQWVQTISRDVVITAGYIHVTDFLPVYFSGGRGTETNPYRIASVQDLLELSDYVASTDEDKLPFRTACYRQMADIDFNGGTLPSIGNSNAASPYSFFNGTYEGNGFKVSNVFISNPNSTKAHGFFGYLDGDAHIDGLKLENVTIDSPTWNNGTIVGCVQSTSHALIENCEVTGGSVTGADSQNGGLCGKLMAGTIRSCSYQGSVTGTASTKHQCGGIVGQVSNAGCLVENCYFDGTVTGACGNVGGIVGSCVGSSSVVACSVSAATVVKGGSVEDNGINIGGIVGYINNATGGKVEGCSFGGTVIANYYDVGGIVGRDQGLVIRNCVFSGTVTSAWDESDTSSEKYGRIGGICGHVHGTGYVENCQVSGNVGSEDKRVSYTGGIVGWLELGSIIACSVTSGKTLVVKGKHAVGGIAGQFKSGIIKSCVMNGLTVNASGNYAGGGAGRMTPSASLTNSSLQNSIVSTGGMGAGGMCGLFQTGGYIAQCNVSGSSVSAGTKLAGGILGNMDSCTSATTSKVERCTVSGGSGIVVSADANGIAGGILGGCNTYGAVNLCTSSINVRSASASYVGGIVGWVNSPNMVIANCVYYDGELSAENGNNAGGIAGQFGSGATALGISTLVNCCAFPSKVVTKSANMAGIGGYINTVTIKNCYSPALPSVFYKGSTNDGSGSAGSIYGWLRGHNDSTGGLAGILEDVYYLSGWKAGNFSSSWTYTKSEQALTDSQMRNTGAVSRPSTGEAYGSLLEALNAGADAYNAASPVFGVQAAEWVMGTNSYPVPYGTALMSSSAVSGKKKVSLLGDSITTFQGYTPYPSNFEYPKAANYPDFTSVTQTWWYQLIYNKMTGATLEVNSSYTGTCIQNTTSTGHPGYGFLNRYVELGNPDIILINGGTNDISRSLPVGSLDFTLDIDALDTYQFAQAYDKLIRLLKGKYPSATICCIMGDRFFDGFSSDYTPVVRELCAHYSLPCAEVDYGEKRSACRYSNGSNVHPTPEGMSEMADQIYSQIGAYLQ